MRVLTSLLLLLSLICCTKKETQGPSQQQGPVELTVQVGEEIRYLDPQKATGISSSHINVNLFAGLFDYDPKTNEPVKDMVDSYTQSADSRVWTFKLRKDYYWVSYEQGKVVKKRPITAHDFVYSYQRVLSPELASEYSYMLYIFKNAKAYNEGKIKDANQVGVKALDDYTLEITMEGSVAAFLNYLPHHSFVAVPKEPIEKYGDQWITAGKIWTSGPFTFKEWKLKDRISVVKNPFYHEAQDIQPELIHFKFIGTYSSEAVRAFRAGETDIDLMDPPSSEIQPLKQAGSLDIARLLASYFVRINITKKPLDDVRVRRALALVAPRAELIKYVMKAGQLPLGSIVPDAFETYTPATFEGYTLAQKEKIVLAQKLLAEAGYPEGKGFPQLNYVYNTAETHQKVAVVLAKAWKEHLGITVNPLNQEWKVYLNTQKSMDYELLRAGWVGDYNDPVNFLDMFLTNSGNNNTGFANQEYDNLVAQAQKEGDQAKRSKMMEQAEAILMKVIPAIPLFNYTTLLLSQDYISGVYANKLDQHPLKSVKIDLAKRKKFKTH